MDEYIVTKEENLSPGQHVIVEVRGREIAVFNIDGEHYAYPNWCPHQGGPLCKGKISGTTDLSFDRDTLEYDLTWIKEGEIVICPWHGWQFDMTENAFLHDKDIQLPSYEVRVKDGDIVLCM